MYKRIFSVMMVACSQIIWAQQHVLQAGPMVGYSEMLEVKLWLQTKSAARVYIAYSNDSLKIRRRTDVVLTDKGTAFTAHLLADSVVPGLRYQYEVYINDVKLKFPYPLQFQTLSLWQHRSDPPNFKFALGSCFYANEEAYDRPDRSYGGNYEIFTEIHKHRPDFMVWLGDNVYLREPDWNSRTGILRRYTHTRAVKELQPLLASSHHYAIWDDHDFGPNDASWSFHGKELTLEACKLFWANLNYGVGGTEGITGTFEWGDAQFFLLDDRWYRENPKLSDSAKTMLGAKQLSWLIDALKASKASYKFVAVGSQVLNPNGDFETFVNYKQEREALLEMVFLNKIKNVVFLTGDRHFTELNTMQRGKREVY
ncbi:MAG TPA: alkaline phosphatase D family protein, partial [Cytophagales bacterium]|nr:alkaline phosphatase D family protein [Cytophagales bacterium]